tara:strand:- start:661 stop:954 length:294 start_codon:yes stop_codon:yes gene_type:complete
MKKSELKQIIKEELNNKLLSLKVLEWLSPRFDGFSSDALDGIKYGEVETFQSNEVPESIFNSLKNIDRLDLPEIQGERGYVIYYVPESDEVWFENVI